MASLEQMPGVCGICLVSHYPWQIKAWRGSPWDCHVWPSANFVSMVGTNESSSYPQPEDLLVLGKYLGLSIDMGLLWLPRSWPQYGKLHIIAPTDPSSPKSWQTWLNKTTWRHCSCGRLRCIRDCILYGDNLRKFDLQTPLILSCTWMMNKCNRNFWPLRKRLSWRQGTSTCWP